MTKAFTPITILWIEDNPVWKRTKCAQVKDKNGKNIFDSSLDSEFIPVIEFTNGNEGSEEYFKLKVLQHPEEIKEYYSLCLMIEDKHGARELGKMEGVVPEMVVFDYKLSENITINLSGPGVFPVSYSDHTRPIRKYINPNFILFEKYKDEFPNFQLHLEDPKNIGYDDANFIRRINSPDKLTDDEVKDIETKIKNDEFGLYGGLEIVKHFRQHACVGIPATASKADKKLLHPLSRHYEWLNENDLSSALERNERANKSWDSIVKDGVKQLRKRIIMLVQNGKITPSLVELLQLASGTVLTDGIFSFTSIYGERMIPFNGLFMDEKNEPLAERLIDPDLKRKGITSISQRNHAIFIFANDLLRIVFKNSKHQPEYTIIDKAKEFSKTLWTAYKSERFWHRLNFSKMQKLKESGEMPNIHLVTYNEYIKEFDNKYFSIQKSKSQRGTVTFEITNGIELSGLINKPKTKLDKIDKQILSWTSLFVILRVFKARSEFLKKEAGASFILPTKKELFCFLFPIASTPIILPIHNGDDSNLRRYLTTLFFNFDNLVDAKENFFDLGTKYILKLYAKSIGLTEEKYFPDWLK